MSRAAWVLLGLLAAGPFLARAEACDGDGCRLCTDGAGKPVACKERGRMLDNSRAFATAAPPSAEQTAGVVGMPSGARGPAGGDACGEGSGTAGDLPFRITIDGVPLAEDALRPEPDRRRCVDLALEKADIQIKYDPLNVAPALNVWTTPSGVLRGEPIEFFTYSNYTAWIVRAEVRVFPGGRFLDPAPLAVLPVPVGGAVRWQAPADLPGEVLFVLRVYDRDGRFDETAAKPLRILERRTAFADTESPGREKLTGWGQNSRKIANITVYGGTVTVSGSGVQSGQAVAALGAPVPVDPAGRFATRQIMPPGPHSVEVTVTGADGRATTFRRNLDIADRDWFYIALFDVTAGRNSASGPARLVTADSQHYDGSTYVDGRGAFYLKGKIKGEYLLTMSADTGEQPIQDLFSNFASKNPYYLLRRIDPDRYYPVYGDDSTTVDDAPTQGKFYVRIERGDSFAMWGNFQTVWTGTELTQYSRGLYGGNLLWNSTDATGLGERRSTVNAFAADPGTIQSREEFRGTGGSLYYLRHQDITLGSERAWVEVRDKDTGFVIDRRPLASAQDYDVNYLQGMLVLRAPLPSTAASASLVQTGALPGNPVYLVVTYEYVPGFTKVDGLAMGLRASHWFNDHLRLGLTGYSQGTDGPNHKLGGVDTTLRYKPGTWLKAEIARSEGPGVPDLVSPDGGFGFVPLASGGRRADAQRVEVAAELGEVFEGAQGRIGAYWQNRDAGFSAPGQTAFLGEAVAQRGLVAKVPVTAATTLDLKADARETTLLSNQAVEASVRHQLTPEWGIAVGARRDDLDAPVPNASRLLSQNGDRTDLALRLDYRPLLAPEQVEAVKAEAAAIGPLAPEAAPRAQPWDVYGFVQGTVARSGNRSDNDRAGVGGGWQVNDRLRLTGEVSGGDGGPGVLVGGDWRVDDRSSYYLNYTLETERPDAAFRGRQGNLVTGSRYRLTDQIALFGESRWANGAGPESLTQAFGVDLAPNDRWSLGAKVERGALTDPLAGDLTRYAVGLAAAYKFDGTLFASALEYRSESGVATERSTWLMRNTFGHQAMPALRLFGKFNFSLSDASLGSFFDAQFVEGVLGLAWRPVDNDRWNTLFKYTYFYNLPSPGQVSNATGQVLDFAQKSQVLSLDTIWDARPWVSLGFKYGFRWGELRDSRVGGPWLSSKADLVIGRADFHWVREWDAVVEARNLRAWNADDSRFGFLVGIYRQVAENVKVGAGYNFTDFSDNLTDLSFRSRGWFVNALSTF